MLVSGSIYFLGKYRPLYIEDTAMVKVKYRMLLAVQDCDPALRDWLIDRINSTFLQVNKPNCFSASADHCDRGVSFAKRPHDNFLDNIIVDMTVCPGLNYNA